MLRVDHDIVDYRSVRLTGEDTFHSLTVISAADAVACMRGLTLARAKECIRKNELAVGHEGQKTLAIIVQLITSVC